MTLPTRPDRATGVACWLLPLACVLGGGPALAQDSAPAAAATVDNETCLGCHTDASLTAETERAKKLTLVVKEDILTGSAHEGLACTDCHTGAKSFEDVPHNEGKPLTLGCATCHEEVDTEYQKSIHGGLRRMGDTEAATCSDCHGTHDILGPKDRRSKVNKFNLSKTCATCHQGGQMLKTHDIAQKEPVQHYIDSIHGRALLVDGLSVAATCNDCHGVHDILPHENVRSRISKQNVPKTCGTCHVLVEEVYNKSIHGRLLAAGDKRGPTCIDCHSSHEISQPRREVFKLSIDHKCGSCHEDKLERYRETFHGKAIALGRTGVAACYDCHGHHDIQKSSDPASHTSEARRLETCRKCHADANENFSNYLVHASHTDKESAPQVYYVYVFMTALLLGTFLFFAVHSVLWLLRSTVLYIRDSKTFRETKFRARADDEEFVRFRPVDRFIHALIIFSFLLLVLTGMPLKFYYTDWARWMLDVMGGQAVAAVLHRVGAIVTLFYFALHISTMTTSIWRARDRFKDATSGRYTLRSVLSQAFGPDSPAPNLQDLRDFVAHQKWFFGRGEKPQFDRWTYWEKFDYMAVFWGVAVIGLSGLIMWFPESFTTVLPGWMINVALVIHSDEALLAAGFIFTFHFFNVHFRLEKFPMDPIIFSGRISKTELLHERKRQYERWVAEGTLDEHRLKDEWLSWKRIALPAGFAAFLTGVVIVVLIYAAMYSRLLQN
ncbi:MAG: hypothetical protein ABIJ09_21985 [Pseudomonadota bacterium]